MLRSALCVLLRRGGNGAAETSRGIASQRSHLPHPIVLVATLLSRKRNKNAAGFSGSVWQKR